MWIRSAAGRIIAAVLLMAAAARLYGIGWGLPHVYEEAQPLKQAWEMWGWGPDASFDLNPHFFHYPTLSLYVQLGGQAALYTAMRAAGAVDSTVDFRVRYHIDPSPFYYLGRLLNVVFGVLTVFLTYRIGRRAGGDVVAVMAAFLLAVNLFHASRSQMVEVDVPLTFFVTLAMALLLGLAESPTGRNYALAAAAVGLAAATKYTGAFLVFPLVVAHIAARRTPARPGWRWLAAAGGISLAVFVLASPYVALDFPAFRADFAAERAHMRLGHFGLDAQSGWRYYTVAFARLAGWPVVGLAAAGFVGTLFLGRRRWSLIIASFAVPYVLAISSWAMAADRYALPVLPLLLVYACAGAVALIERLPDGRAWRTVAVAVALVVVAAPLAVSLPRYVERYEVDSRTECLRWVEQNLPAGSFLVSEAYGPPLEGPVEYWQLPGDIRDRVYERRKDRPFYSLYHIPLSQMEPERTGPFYELRLYRDADALITTGAVRSRYLREPERFAPQAAFYDSIDAYFEEVTTFEASGEGSSITVYRNRRHQQPFAGRPVAPIPRLRAESSLLPYWPGTFYCRMAVNYEAFGHLPQAIGGYEMALPFAAEDSGVFREATYGMVRCLVLSGETERAAAFIERVLRGAPKPGDLEFLQSLADRIQDPD
jgi:4-amino-4-deoxy-L-arabinose transferase-like glycosyltransferase